MGVNNMDLAAESLETARQEDSLKKLPITRREQDVLINLALGRSNKDIAKVLQISSSTIRNHISSIYTKLRVSNRSQATAKAIYAGLLNFDDIKEINKKVDL